MIKDGCFGAPPALGALCIACYACARNGRTGSMIRELVM